MRVIHAGLVVAILFVLQGILLAHYTARAQGPEVLLYQEDFDDGQAEGWELEQGWTVTEGSLCGEGHKWATPAAGPWQESRAQFRLKLLQGSIHLNYRVSGLRRYFIGFREEGLYLAKQTGPDTFVELAVLDRHHTLNEWHQVEIAGQGGHLQVNVDGALILDYTDGDALAEGGIAFETLADGVACVDDIAVYGTAPTPPPTPDPSLTWIRTGGPPGGLGYDIRYNFDDPNVWYVTDNFAGVHISTDNGLTWQPSNSGIPRQAGPTGDAIPIFSLTVDPHDPEIIWAGTDRTGHIYRSTDGGRTWEQRDNGVTVDYDGLTFRGFTVDPRSSDIVYAMGETTDEALGGPSVWGSGTGGVVYKTTNRGEYWELIWGEPPPSSLTRYMWIDPRNPDVLYVSTGIFDRGAVGEGDPLTDPLGGLGVLKSTDGGQSWRVLNEDNGLRMLYLGSLFMHPEDPDILLASAGHTMGGREGYIEGLIGQGIDSPAGVYRTTDGGEHWMQMIVPPGERVGEAFSSVELCPSDPNVGYAGSESTIYRTDDAGETWELVSGGEYWGPPGVQAGWPIDMQCDPRDPNRVFANNYNGGNFLSEDGGRTWRNASQGYTGAQMRGVAADLHSSARVYAAGRNGIWRTDDGGALWSGMFYPPADAQVFGLEWQAVAVDPGRRDHVLVGTIVGTVLMESEDGGASWQVRWSLERILDELPRGIGSQVPSAIVFAPSEPATVYAAIGFDWCVMGHEPVCEAAGVGVIVSHDGGTSWARAVDEHLSDVGVLDLAVDPTDAQTVYAAAATGLFRTTDGGSSWTPLAGLPEGSVVRTVAVNPRDSRHVLVGVEAIGIYRSADGGQNWQGGVAGLEPNNSLHDLVFDPTNPRVVYTSDYLSGVYRSMDGGLTWTKINNGLRNRSAMGLTVSGDGQHLYVATNGEGVFRLDLSGQPPQPGAQASPTTRVGPVLPVGTPSEVQPTGPPEEVAAPSPVAGICPLGAALPLALVGLVVLSRQGVVRKGEAR